MNQIPVTQARTLRLRVLRHNPADPQSEPHLQEYRVEEADAMTLFVALNLVREEQDPSLVFDFVCRAGICGSCGMLINGSPASPAAPLRGTCLTRSRWRRCRVSS